MAKAHPAAGRGLGLHARFLLGGCLLFGACVGSARCAPPSVAKMLEYTPRQEIACTTPTPAEQAACKVELDEKGRGSGWVLKGADGKPLRRFFASNKRNVDLWSYYKDGVEVYREMDTTGSGRPDQYRWLASGGSKWGVDHDKDGKIDAWRVISPEEVSQEVLRALATRNLARLQALMISDEEIKALALPADLASALRERRKGAKAKFEATIAKLTKLTEKANWIHLETSAPECILAEQIGARGDLIRHARGTVLFESGGANDWFQVGPMIQVGAAWRIIDAPAPGAAVTEESKDGSKTMDLDPKVQKLVEGLTTFDKQRVPSSGPEAVRHHLSRADILEKIVNAIPAKERDPWIRQVADSLASAAQASGPKDVAPGQRLANLEKQLVQHMPGSNLTAYVVFRRLQADYSKKLEGDPKTFEKVQKEWVATLTTFVKDYPKAEDTPDAMLQLGMVSEFLGKDVEAKNWYAGLARNFPDKPQAPKAQGAARRLDMEGKPFHLAAPLLNNAATPFDISQMKGKVVIVYYWASWNGQAASDFARLKSIVTANGRAVDLLSVNLDTTVEEARRFLGKNPVPGTHVYQPGGLDSRLATDYGVMMLPSVFVVGKDGKCVSRNAQISSVEDEVKKQLKK
jgi:hypothetical protein